MKNWFKHISILFTGAALLTISCEDSDKVVDQVVDATARGAILRTVSVQQNEIFYDVASSSVSDGGFSVVLEVQDQEQGSLVSAIEVYVGFRDNTVGSVDNDREEVLAETIPASEFATKGPFGLPRLEYTMDAETLLAAVGLANDQVFGGDQFTIRFELVLADGRRFSFADNTGTLTGSFFSSPFLYIANLVCAPSEPTVGTWTVNAVDTFGDGWNGGQLNIFLDDNDPIILTNIDDGTRPFAESVQQFTFEVPVGTETISIIYSPGAFDEEVLFTVTSANGNVVVDVGPNPTYETELLDFCPDNL
jgi:hypothetical protein